VLKSFRPDLAHVSAVLIPSHRVWIPVLRRANVPYVISPHGLLSPLGMSTRFNARAASRHRIRLKKAYFGFLDLPMLRAAAALHAQADYESELIAGFGLANTFTIPLGVDEEWVNSGVDRRAPHDPTTFTYLGRLDIYHKGLDLILAGFRELARQGLHKKARLIIAGSDVGGSRGTIMRRLREAGLENVEVREPTWGGDKEVLWKETDYFLSVFRYAGMARATAEALGQGIPVVASREGNWGDWVRRHDMGFCVEADERSVADLLCRIVTDESTRYVARAKNALSFACSHSWQWVAAEMTTAYERLLARR